ncbi:ABC1 kinase family protein [Geminocystis herdmanii]|uniref:ABC1 kinase family protein n=1 Tax=Geminocystis herdmanii TaxID=669359 RepID=UPI000349B0FC|nr:AarF/ABC1/UbiB kinase family protein [Geminocystis herdmanii]
MFSLTKTSSRQKEIIEIVLGNGWDYMRGILTGGKSDKPQLPPPEVFRKILVQLGPFYVKFGQLLSTRPDLLPPKYIEALTALQAQVPPVAWGLIEQTLREQLESPIETIFSTIDPQPVAAGSIAQIHKATLTTGEEVAIKVQRPNIDRIVNQDVILIKGIADIIALTDFGSEYDVVNLADDFTKAVLAELDFRQEANFTDKLRQNLTNSPWFDSQQLVIPKIYWQFTTEKVLLMEWLDGKPILSADIPSTPKTRQEVSTLLFRVFFQQIFIDGFFHADPHPGNIFYLEDNKIGLIDCGMIGRLDPKTQQLLTEMLLAIVDIDAQRCAQLTLELSDTNAINTNIARLENDYQKMLRKYYNLSLSQLNFSEVFYEILEVARSNKIRLPSNMGLFAKSLANLEGVARKFNPNINLLEEIKPLITELFRRQFIGDTPYQTLFRTVLDLKSISLRSPRQIDAILDRLSSETFQWQLQIREIEGLRRSVDDSANRLSFSIVVGSLIMGAAIISTGATTGQLILLSNVLFTVATLLGLWLIISILRSGRLK